MAFRKPELWKPNTDGGTNILSFFVSGKETICRFRENPKPDFVLSSRVCNFHDLVGTFCQKAH